MSRRNEKAQISGNTWISFAAMLIISYFIIWGTLLSAFAISGVGSILDMILGIVEVLPFGNTFLKLAVTITSSLFQSSAIVAEELQNLAANGKNMLPLMWVRELCKLILAAGFNSALYAFLEMTTGLKDAKGVWNFLKKAVMTMLSAYLGAYFATIALEAVYSQIGYFTSGFQIFIASAISLISVGGVFAIMALLFLNGGSLLIFFIYFLTRYILLNTAKTAIVFIALLLFLILMQGGNFKLVIACMGSLLPVMIILIGIDMMLGSAFGYGD